jgi:DNA-binding NarL/FixJ family response regulator
MIRLLLVDDHSLIRQGLEVMLTQEPDLQVVGCAENGQVALDLVATLQPDVVLMDIRMPVMTGIEATLLISEKFPNTKVLVLSTFEEDRNIAESMRAGAKGYLLKDTPAPELAEAIRSVHRGYSQMAPGLMERLLTSVPSSDDVEAQPVPEELTQLPPRERDVLRVIGQGATNREIAVELHLAEGTVKTYVTHLLRRLSLKNRAQLAIYSTSITSALNS